MLHITRVKMVFVVDSRHTLNMINMINDEE